MFDELSSERLEELERAIDQNLYDSARSLCNFLQTPKYAPADAPGYHTALVMRAIYAEAAQQGDLLAPLAGALSFHELMARTGLDAENLERALWTLIVEEKRLRTRDEGAGRIYFLPTLTRKMLKQALLRSRLEDASAKNAA